MRKHLYTGRCILFAGVALIGATAAQAAPNDGPAKDASKDASPAISLDRLGGTWKNAKSGVDIRIEQGAVGWEVWFSTSGQARITLPEKNRPAIKIDGRDFTCSYSVTLPTPQTMKWDLTRGQPEAQCPTGVFTRLGPAPSQAKRSAPAAPTPETKQVVKHEPAPAGPPAEVVKPRLAARGVEPSGGAPTMAPSRRMHRHWAGYPRPLVRRAVRGWRRGLAPRWRYEAARYWPYRYFHYRYRWYVILPPRCGCR